MNEHSDPSVPKPDEASSRPAPPLTPPATEATADPFAAPGGATDTKSEDNEKPAAPAVTGSAGDRPAAGHSAAADGSAGTSADAPAATAPAQPPGAVGADPSVLAAAAGIEPSAEPGADSPPAGSDAAEPLAGSAADHGAAGKPSVGAATTTPMWPESGSGRVPVDSSAAGADSATAAQPPGGAGADRAASGSDQSGSGASAVGGAPGGGTSGSPIGGPGSEPLTRAVPAGPLPPRMEPRGDTPPHGVPQPGGPGATPPPVGPPTGGFPAGPPPMGGQRFGSAPPKQRSKAPALIAAALVIALGAGTAGGVAGYALSEAGGGNDSSSPSEQIADGNTISDIAKKVQPSVVSIATEQAGGSGVVYDDQGHIITNNHVAETAQGGKLEVTFADGNTAAASVVGTDPTGDLAVIKVDDVANLTPIEMGDSGSLDVGDTVLAIGSPLGLDGSVTSGIVSALDRTVQAGGGEQGGQATTLNGLIQTDAAINPGNSGGALVNGKGELIGINTVIATTGSSEGSVGLGFAIPSGTVASTAEQLIEGGGVEHGYLGVSVTDNVSGSEGAVVNEVADNSPADKAGLKRGDVITAVDGEKIAGAADVGAVVQGAEPGTKVDIKYTRDGKEESTSAELGSTGSTG